MIFALIPYAIIFFTGIVTFLAINKREDVHLFEVISLSWLLGSAIIWLQVAFLMFVGDRMSIVSLLFINLGIIGAFHLVKWQRVKVDYAIPWLMFIPLSVCAYAFYLAWANPYIFADAQYYVKHSLEMLKGTGGVFLAGRPMMFSGLMSYVFKFAGLTNAGPIFIFPLFYSALILYFYATMKRETSDDNKAAFFTFLLAGFPLFFYHAKAIYCDLALAAYFFAATISAKNWLRAGWLSDFIFLVILGSAVFFSKNAGFMLVLMLVTMIGGHKLWIKFS